MSAVQPEPGQATPPAAERGWLDTALAYFVNMSTTTQLVLTGAFLVLAVGSLWFAARITKRAAAKGLGTKDQRMFFAALGFGGFFWLAVLAASFQGLLKFGSEVLRWHNGMEYLVPLTLDGAAIAFGVLAFRAVLKGKNPDRANRVVWAATLGSALINLGTEWAESKLGAGYLALMSFLGMIMFHEFLHQFEAAKGADWIKRDKPKFGMRWLTWPTNTICAWIAWHNYPPAEGTPATVTTAVQNLNRARSTKSARRVAAFHPNPAWAPLLPWLRVAQLRAVLAEQAERSGAATAALEQAEREASALRATIAEQAERIAALTEQMDAERSTTATERAERERMLREAEQRSSQLAEQRSALAEQVAEQSAAMQAVRSGAEQRSTQPAAPVASRPSRRKTAPAAPAAASGRRRDDADLASMFAEHPERDYNWGPREVNRITGAGFSSRAPRLVAAAEQHLADCAAPNHSTCYAEQRSTSQATEPAERSAETEQSAPELHLAPFALPAARPVTAGINGHAHPTKES